MATSWRVPDKNGLFEILFKSGSSRLGGHIYAPSDLCFSSVIFFCSSPPKGFAGEVTFSLCGAQYHDKSKSLKSMDSTCSWPEASDPYNGPVVELFWNTKAVGSRTTVQSSVASTLAGGTGDHNVKQTLNPKP
jgi:hypothetical protein